MPLTAYVHVIQAIITRVTLTVLQFSVLSAIMTGISGSLSTVSTWVVEVRGPFIDCLVCNMVYTRT